jgi:endonuclease YncB( thermonuclease family)
LWRTAIDVVGFMATLVCVLLLVEYFGGVELAPGGVRVIDGDSLREGSTEIRLFGIDAPEYKQTCLDQNRLTYGCGKRASEELRDLVALGKLTCVSSEVDRYHRAISRCKVGPLDINREMVLRGWAVAFVRYSSDYVPAQLQARKAKRGLWAGNFEDPATYREHQRTVQSSAGGVYDGEVD